MVFHMAGGRPYFSGKLRVRISGGKFNTCEDEEFSGMAEGLPDSEF
jgi:hypothetical protein